MPPIQLGFVPTTRRAYDALLLRGVDGDTIDVQQAVRMVSIDTPESKLGGNPATAQRTLDRCRNRLESGDYDEIGQPLREHLLSRLTPDAARRHLDAGTARAPRSSGCAPPGWSSTPTATPRSAWSSPAR
ncbi:hypothetical protein BJF78_21285 [Pseudonocardia sp. CNS-139]|nr:hypothetical protein BJF78_21285 [Pseudonocardia sp. CNS-139]